MKKMQCYKCDQSLEPNNALELFDYTICKPCKKDLGLLQDRTIEKHHKNFDSSYNSKFDSKSYSKEIDHRLDYIEKYYISSKIKLLHIKDRLKHL
jgi:hypothetical protein